MISLIFDLYLLMVECHIKSTFMLQFHVRTTWSLICISSCHVVSPDGSCVMYKIMIYRTNVILCISSWFICHVSDRWSVSLSWFSLSCKNYMICIDLYLLMVQCHVRTTLIDLWSCILLVVQCHVRTTWSYTIICISFTIQCHVRSTWSSICISWWSSVI